MDLLEEFEQEKTPYKTHVKGIEVHKSIVCKGGSKANPTHPSLSSWPAASREFVSLISSSFFSTIFFCIKMAIISKKK
jgi:hypothetical protein